MPRWPVLETAACREGSTSRRGAAWAPSDRCIPSHGARPQARKPGLQPKPHVFLEHLVGGANGEGDARPGWRDSEVCTCHPAAVLKVKAASQKESLRLPGPLPSRLIWNSAPAGPQTSSGPQTEVSLVISLQLSCQSAPRASRGKLNRPLLSLRGPHGGDDQGTSPNWQRDRTL